MRSAIDLLTQYAAYHRDQRNIATHFIGIPMIVCAIGALLSRPVFGLQGVELAPVHLALALATVWYLTRHVLLGLLTAAAVGALAMIGVFLAGHTTGSWLGWGLGLFFVGWVLQFLGHYYEGRKPAFVDDLIGLLVGPMFIVAEALFSAGWNRQMLVEIERRVGPTHLRNLAHA
ncbi:MAG: DUF962 domain-containing protein [Aquabacterium sp.]|jgi:uncharacterized membrane protein YGL010W|nr:MAG: DUF962 domain-containing protein [Aquabacterium sp.]